MNLLINIYLIGYFGGLMIMLFDSEVEEDLKAKKTTIIELLIWNLAWFMAVYNRVKELI
jgi:hypothetical protein